MTAAVTSVGVYTKDILEDFGLEMLLQQQISRQLSSNNQSGLDITNVVQYITALQFRSDRFDATIAQAPPTTFCILFSMTMPICSEHLNF